MVTVYKGCRRWTLLQFTRHSQAVVEIPGELVLA